MLRHAVDRRHVPVLPEPAATPKMACQYPNIGHTPSREPHEDTSEPRYEKTETSSAIYVSNDYGATFSLEDSNTQTGEVAIGG